MSSLSSFLAVALVCALAGCGGDDDDGDERASDMNSAGNGGSGGGSGGGGSGGGSGQQPMFPSEEEINAALADAGVFFDEAGVTIGDSRIDLGPDGIRLDDASVISVNEGGVVIGEGDASITIRTDGTCAELLSCCEEVSDEAKKTECTTAHDNLVGIPLGGGDFLCGQTVALYCP